MQASSTIFRRMTGLLLAMALSLAACGILYPQLQYVASNGTGETLRTKTTIGAKVPIGCPTTTISAPTHPNGFAVTYREPSTTVTGTPLTDLLLTSIYLSSPLSRTQVIQVWANNPKGGGTVTIRNIVPPPRNMRICVTATNLSGQESAPATPPRP